MNETKKVKINDDAPEEKDDAADFRAEDAPTTGEGGVSTGELLAQLEEKDLEIKEIYDRLLRVSAEFDNYKKRTAREVSDFRKFANQTLLRELLTVVDNLERAVASSGKGEQTPESLVEGVRMTLDEIHKIFTQFHVEPIEAKGKPFDPNFHQAIMREETDEHPENTVISEFQKGYMIHDRLLRPSMVVVSVPTSNAADKNE